MNDKINNLIDQLKVEIDAYIQEEISHQQGRVEVAGTEVADYAPPADPANLAENSDMPLPAAPPINVSIPPMSEPTPIASNPVDSQIANTPADPIIPPGQETRDFSEANTFGAAQMTETQGETFNQEQANSAGFSPDTPVNNDLDPNNLNPTAVDLSAFSESQETTSPPTANLTSDFVNPPAQTDNFNAPATDLPEPNFNINPAADSPSTFGSDLPLPPLPSDLPPVAPVNDLPPAPELTAELPPANPPVDLSPLDNSSVSLPEQISPVGPPTDSPSNFNSPPIMPSAQDFPPAEPAAPPQDINQAAAPTVEQVPDGQKGFAAARGLLDKVLHKK